MPKEIIIERELPSGAGYGFLSSCINPVKSFFVRSTKEKEILPLRLKV